jgi:hypothetical protein
MFTAVFDRIPEEILEDLLEPAGIRLYGSFRYYPYRCLFRLYILPTGLGKLTKIDRFNLTDVIAFPSKRKQIVNQCRHSILGLLNSIKMVTPTLL